MLTHGTATSCSPSCIRNRHRRAHRSSPCKATGEAPLALDATMRITNVHLLQPDSGVSYRAAAYHPEPRNKKPAFHSALLTQHGRASATITATHARALRCDDSDSRLDYTPLDNPANQ